MDFCGDTQKPPQTLANSRVESSSIDEFNKTLANKPINQSIDQTCEINSRGKSIEHLQMQHRNDAITDQRQLVKHNFCIFICNDH